MKNVLSIAGFDPSGGAGVLADIKTFNACGINGFGITTGTSFQNAHTFTGIEWSSFEVIVQQLKPLKDETVNAVKIGIIENAATLIELLKEIRSLFPSAFIIWDPVLATSSGYTFHHELNHEELEFILNSIDCITPNTVELELIIDWLGLSSFKELPTNYLVKKDGHGTTKSVNNQLWNVDSLIYESNLERLSKGIHGSGCVFSAVIAAEVAKGNAITDAFKTAENYLTNLIQHSSNNLGQHHLISLTY